MSNFVTYSDLFQYTIVLLTVILVFHSRKK